MLFVTVVTQCDICAYFDGFQIAAVSLIAEFSFRFCCFVFDVKQLLKVIFFIFYYVMKKEKMGAN